MRVASIDQGYVRAPREKVFDLIRDPAGYPRWWPGVREAGAGRLNLPVLGVVEASSEELKEGVQVRVPLKGRAVTGHLLWHLKTFKDGTLVYGAIDVETRGKWRPGRVMRARASMHRAMFAMKDLLE